MIPTFSKELIEMLEGLKLALEEIERGFVDDFKSKKQAADLIGVAAAGGAMKSTRTIIMAVQATINTARQKIADDNSKRNVMDKEYLRAMSEVLKSKLPDNFGYLLMAAPLGDNPGRLVYTSTIDRKDAINMLKEFLLRNDAVEDWMKHIK